MREFFGKAKSVLGSVASKVQSVGSKAFVRCAAFAAVGMAALTGTAFAEEGTEVLYSVVERGADGKLIFKPENLVNPILDGYIATIAIVGGIVLLLVVVGFIFAWLRKK